MFERKPKLSPQRKAQLERYQQLVTRLAPKSKLGQGMARAYWVGGVICCIGQLLLE